MDAFRHSWGEAFGYIGWVDAMTAKEVAEVVHVQYPLYSAHICDGHPSCSQIESKQRTHIFNGIT